MSLANPAPCTRSLLTLHVWAPSFGLPSLEPQCLAAISYLCLAVPKDRWRLLGSCDAGLSPTNELPVLRSGDSWIAGFGNIVEFLREYSNGKWDLDVELEGRERADCIAFSSYLLSDFQPLLDLSLYVSTNNYVSATRPLLSTLLPFPLPYLVPPSLRAAAKLRTEHLGFASLDIDSSPNPSPTQSNSIIPPSLQTTRNSLTSLLSASPETTAMIRLSALTSSVLAPIQSLIKFKPYLLSSTRPSSLDCLAFAYLSLALLPQLPSPWLAKTIQQASPELCHYVHSLQYQWFGGEVTIQQALLTKSNEPRYESVLPWATPEPRSVAAVGGLVAAALASSLPLASQLRPSPYLSMPSPQPQPQTPETTTAPTLLSLSIPAAKTVAILSSVMAGIALSLGILVQQGFLVGIFAAGRDEDGAGLSDFGDAGAALAVFRAVEFEAESEWNTRKAREEREGRGEPVVEVDVEVDAGARRSL